MKKEPIKPIHRIRYGAISVAIWENKGASGVFYNATLERTYRDEKEALVSF